MKAISIAATAAICLVALTARAADIGSNVGFYAGVGGGVTGADRDDADANDSLENQHGGALKVFGGYQIDRHFGVEGGYLRTGRFSQVRTVDGEQVKQSVKTRAWYAAATARAPIGDDFAFTATIGAAFGKVTGEDTVPGEASLLGHKTSVMAGLGGQYRVSRTTLLQLDLTGIDDLSRNMSLGGITLSVRKHF